MPAGVWGKSAEFQSPASQDGLRCLSQGTRPPPGPSFPIRDRQGSDSGQRAGKSRVGGLARLLPLLAGRGS